jgi:uncharacterized membrane protein
MVYRESRKRTITKILVWRVTAFLITMIASLILTGDVGTAFKIGILDVIIKLCMDYLYERFWNKVKWGKIEIVGQKMEMDGIEAHIDKI